MDTESGAGINMRVVAGEAGQLRPQPDATSAAAPAHNESQQPPVTSRRRAVLRSAVALGAAGAVAAGLLAATPRSAEDDPGPAATQTQTAKNFAAEQAQVRADDTDPNINAGRATAMPRPQ